MTICNESIPVFFPWSASEDFKKGGDQIKNNSDPDNQIGTKNHKRGLSNGHKDFQVLK